MPTQTDFEIAAEKFTTAAGLVSQFASTASGASATGILRGGSLGRQVSERIAAAQETANACHGEIVRAATICAERAGIIATYEEQLAMYDTKLTNFQSASRAWASAFNAWFADETGTIPKPGDAPRPPERPTPPPAWAEVRRP